MVIRIEDLNINRFIFENINQNYKFFSYKQGKNEKMEKYDDDLLAL